MFNLPMALDLLLPKRYESEMAHKWENAHRGEINRGWLHFEVAPSTVPILCEGAKKGDLS